MPDSRCCFGGRIGQQIVGFRGEFVRFSRGGGMQGGGRVTVAELKYFNGLKGGVSYWLLWDSYGIGGCLDYVMSILAESSKRKDRIYP